MGVQFHGYSFLWISCVWVNHKIKCYTKFSYFANPEKSDSRTCMCTDKLVFTDNFPSLKKMDWLYIK